MPISRRSINYWLQWENFKYSKVAQRLSLSNKDKNVRFSRICDWIEKNIEWENIVFLKKNDLHWMVQITGNIYKLCLNTYLYVFSKLIDIHTIKKTLRNRAKGDGIMVWGMFISNGILTNKLLHGKIRSHYYIHMLHFPLSEYHDLPYLHHEDIF